MPNDNIKALKYKPSPCYMYIPKSMGNSVIYIYVYMYKYVHNNRREGNTIQQRENVITQLHPGKNGLTFVHVYMHVQNVCTCTLRILYTCVCV